MAKKDKIQLSHKISKYIPEIKSDLTINDLLNHKTNLASIQVILEQNPELEYSTIEYVNLAVKSTDKSERSDLDYNILGLLFGLIGPDGAGKTTIFRILTTLLIPDEGTAKVVGFDIIADYKAIRNSVGYMHAVFSLD